MGGYPIILKSPSFWGKWILCRYNLSLDGKWNFQQTGQLPLVHWSPVFLRKSHLPLKSQALSQLQAQMDKRPLAWDYHLCLTCPDALLLCISVKVRLLEDNHSNINMAPKLAIRQSWVEEGKVVQSLRGTGKLLRKSKHMFFPSIFTHKVLIF